MKPYQSAFQQEVGTLGLSVALTEDKLTTGVFRGTSNASAAAFECYPSQTFYKYKSETVGPSFS